MCCLEWASVLFLSDMSHWIFLQNCENFVMSTSLHGSYLTENIPQHLRLKISPRLQPTNKCGWNPDAITGSRREDIYHARSLLTLLDKTWVSVHCRAFSLTWQPTRKCIWTEHNVYIKKSSSPTELVWYTNTAALMKL